MKVAVIGCVHGQLTLAYKAIQRARIEPQLVIMCGDIQACRKPADLLSMSVPAKYRSMGDFHEYFRGKRKAPYLTIVIGGNHEASNYMSTMPQGGWLAPKIWYLGDSGIVSFKGLVVGGISGIWYAPDFDKPHFEAEEFAQDFKKACESDSRFSVYHTRRIDIDKLAQIKPQKIDIMVSHDWPRGVEQSGDLSELLRQKPWFRSDIEAEKLGNPATRQLLAKLQPQWWLSAHLHTYFRATIGITEFMALDKVLNRRQFMEIIDVHPRNKTVVNDDFIGFTVKHLD